MKKIKLEILGLSSSQSQTGSFALVLGETEGNRRLPIIIGMFEAQAIAIEIEKIIPNRPMTHDLFKSFANSFNFHVEEIVISDLKEGVFFAKIMCTDGLKKHEVDARPSDAIAIGLRFDAPIFTYENILAEAGIVLTDEEEEEKAEPAKESKVRVKKEKPTGDDFKNYSVDKLNELLKDAIEKENYERAAKIRDELSKRN
ncbi:MAG TPA: bifunctional nuclease family protein [Cyclobacteriaceae bacterium]|nr:bifunctional nuclease family protein [Cyclobacteriaceae bacterium]MCB9239341.1 bifunctional nuclease family protein [Flammeovirgaceae bacterium]MCB0500057.1 bifunctional nuclease family protein [Cyclobacteriaceae bacterium]MCO5271346.1 bifunctional nuclease family protein [Cyclobacteriaceae bacterium]MCW5903669.1 bifunctional nuclease family protein [Cyclobacteriaceae bacterium]